GRQLHAARDWSPDRMSGHLPDRDPARPSVSPARRPLRAGLPARPWVRAPDAAARGGAGLGARAPVAPVRKPRAGRVRCRIPEAVLRAVPRDPRPVLSRRGAHPKSRSLALRVQHRPAASAPPLTHPSSIRGTAAFLRAAGGVGKPGVSLAGVRPDLFADAA